MNQPGRSHQDDFAAWLDAGQSMAHEWHEANVPELDAAVGAAMRLRELNQEVERQAAASSPRRTSLEAILAAAAVAPTQATLGTPDESKADTTGEETRMVISIQARANGDRGRSLGMAVSRYISLAAIVAVVIASSGAVWFNRDRLGFGGSGDGGPETVDILGSLPQDDDGLEVSYEVPSAEDCTVEPLTVDEVMEMLQVWPPEWEYGAPGTGLPSSAQESVTPVAEGTPEGKASFGEREDSGQEPALMTLPEVVYDEVAAVQREWLACALHGSPFQRWALETSRMVTREFEARYFPVFDMAHIRRDLEALARGEASPFSSPTLTGDSLLPMAPAYFDGYYNVMFGDGDVMISVVWVRPDGSTIVNANEEFIAAANLERWLPTAWRFMQNPATGQWHLAETRVGMG